MELFEEVIASISKYEGGVECLPSQLMYLSLSGFTIFEEGNFFEDETATISGKKYFL